MLSIFPKRAWFHFEIPLRYRAPRPIDGDLGKWDAHHLVPPLVVLEDRDPLADVYWAWNEEGIVVAFDVPGRTTPLRCDPVHWWKLDGVRICIDTRDTRDAKRATRFCHFFYVLPTGGGPQHTRPIVGAHRMSRAKEHAPRADAARVRVAVHVGRRGYGMEVGIPAACLHGWDPAEHPRIGFFYKIKDTQLGAQHLTVPDDLGWNVDPSTWARGVLVR